ncbi:MAG: response regulator [Proteobacteria bacterium]|nr:response regulator [Pseudomonadota bacterium]
MRKLEARKAVGGGDASGGGRSRRGLLLACGGFLLFSLILLPFSGLQLPAAPAAVTISSSVSVITEALTCFLAAVQYRRRPSGVMWIVVTSYFFASLMGVLHLLVFPGAILPDRPVFGGTQSTGWLWQGWRLGFCAMMLAALLEARKPPSAATLPRGVASALGAGGLLAAAVAMVTLGIPGMPPEIVNGHWSVWALIAPVATLAIAAAVVGLALVDRRLNDPLTDWIGAVALMLALEVGVSAFGGSRYALGWYYARVSFLIWTALLLCLFLWRFVKLYDVAQGALEGAERQTRALEAEILRREAVEHDLLQAQKMEALGQLTAGIAHDFNNMLMVVMGNLHLIRRAKPEKLPRLVDNALTAAEQGRALTQQLQAFSRMKAAAAEVLDLNVEIAGMRQMLAQSLRGDIRIDLQVGDTALCVEVDRGRLQAALINLATNARDAMPKGGAFTVRAAYEADPQGGPGLAVVSVSDTGAGIAPEHLNRVFEPFFTTKEVGKGTGLGLAQVYGFVTQGGGRIDIDSALGHGATFILKLPRVDKAPRTAPPAAPRKAQVARARALLVEDSDDVAEVTRLLLEDLGFEVEHRAGGLEALERLDRRPRFDLVVSDLIMPGPVDGLELARTLRRTRPELPVLLVTGYSEKAGEAAAEGFPLLRKPYDAPGLADAIEALMARREDAMA